MFVNPQKLKGKAGWGRWTKSFCLFKVFWNLLYLIGGQTSFNNMLLCSTNNTWNDISIHSAHLIFPKYEPPLPPNSSILTSRSSQSTMSIKSFYYWKHLCSTELNTALKQRLWIVNIYLKLPEPKASLNRYYWSPINSRNEN